MFPVQTNECMQQLRTNAAGDSIYDPQTLNTLAQPAKSQKGPKLLRLEDAAGSKPGRGPSVWVS